LESINLVPALT